MSYSRRTFLYRGLLTAVPVALHGLVRDTAMDELHKNRECIRPLFSKKSTPKPGDWLASHKEPGQTFLAYCQGKVNRPTRERGTLYIVPLGDFTEEEKQVFRKVMTFMQVFFGLPLQTLPVISLAQIPVEATRMQGERKQLLSTYLLNTLLLSRRPKDAVALLALTPTDLWAGEGWNFVFGQASIFQRVGVWSTARLGNADAATDAAAARQFLRRTIQVAIHETAHMFSLRHCIAYECGMNGSNNLTEADRAPLPFCPECDAKLWWVCKLDPRPRAERLAGFCRIEGLDKEAAHWESVASALAASSR